MDVRGVYGLGKIPSENPRNPRDLWESGPMGTSEALILILDGNSIQRCAHVKENRSLFEIIFKFATTVDLNKSLK